jgi:lysophospholipase L1-like esterase
LSRWNPPLESALFFTGVEVGEGGELLTPPPPPRMRIEFLGDSITEGILAEGKGERPQFPHLTDGRRAYAYQTAERLNAQPRVVGFGRLGITVPGNGGVPVAIDSFLFVYDSVLKDRWSPTAVVINLGTNDGKATAEEFGPKYLEYLQLVRESYGRARIFCMRPFNGAHADEIRQAVVDMRKGMDLRVHYVDTTGWIDPKEDTTDGLHPNIAGHRKAAEKLAAFIRETLDRGYR